MRNTECGMRNTEYTLPLPSRERAGVRGNLPIRNPQSKGFTLVEIVLTIAIVGIIAGVAAMIIMQGAQTYTTEQSRGEAHQQARFALERMSREARSIRSCGDINAPVNPSATLSFTDITGNAIAFSVAAGNLMRGADLLASGVTTAQPFRFLDNAGSPTTSCPGIWFIEIDLADAQGAESLQLRTRIHPRNF